MLLKIAVAVVEFDNHFLVGQRPTGSTLAGKWEFPGGKVEPGESPRDAAIRECREETGLTVEILGAYPDRVHRYDHGGVHLHFFACRPVEPSLGLATPSPPFCWVSRAELGHLTFPEGNRDLLTRILSPS